MPSIVLITRPDPERDMWFNAYVGETFPLRGIHKGIPSQFEVDVSHIESVSPASRGIACVPSYFGMAVEIHDTVHMGFVDDVPVTFMPVVCMAHGGCYGKVIRKDGFHKCARCRLSYGTVK